MATQPRHPREAPRLPLRRSRETTRTPDRRQRPSRRKMPVLPEEAWLRGAIRRRDPVLVKLLNMTTTMHGRSQPAPQADGVISLRARGVPTTMRRGSNLHAAGQIRFRTKTMPAPLLPAPLVVGAICPNRACLGKHLTLIHVLAMYIVLFCCHI